MAGRKHSPKDNNWRYWIFDSLSYPTLILNLDKVIIDVNDCFVREIGSEESAIGKTCHEYFFNTSDLCPNMPKCPLPEVLSERKGKSILVKVEKDGHEKWEDRIYSPIFNEQNEVAYMRVSIRDVTKIKSLEKELFDVKILMEKVVQSSASGIIAADRKGRVLLMNQAAEQLFGYKLEAFNQKKKTVIDFYPEGIAKEIMRKLRSDDYGGKGKLTNTNVDIINSNGERIPGEIAASIIYEDGKEMGTMGIYTDLREKIAVEKKLKETQKRLAQSEKMASIGQLAAGVAHEINNPLTGILFYANMTLESLDENDPVRADMECIIEDVNRCKNIVKDLLTYSRQDNPSKDFIQLNELVDHSLSLIHDQRLFGNVKIEKIMSDEMMLTNVDRNQLNQVIINLIMNAGDAMEGKGTLTIRTYRSKPMQKAYIEISDTGHGIEEKDLPNIFDPFFTTKAPGKGTGLGLSTAYGIIKENEGNISVKETGTEGTTFLIELPLHTSSGE